MLGNQGSLNPTNRAVKETLREPGRAVEPLEPFLRRHDYGAPPASALSTSKVIPAAMIPVAVVVWALPVIPTAPCLVSDLSTRAMAAMLVVARSRSRA